MLCRGGVIFNDSKIQKAQQGGGKRVEKGKRVDRGGGRMIKKKRGKRGEKRGAGQKKKKMNEAYKIGSKKNNRDVEQGSIPTST